MLKKRARKEKKRQKERDQEKTGKKKIVHKNAGIAIGTVVSVWFADKKKYFVGKITERDDYEEDSYKIVWGNGKSEYAVLDEKDNTKDTSNSDRWNIGRNTVVKESKKKTETIVTKENEESSNSALTDEGSSTGSSSESSASSTSEEEEEEEEEEEKKAEEQEIKVGPKHKINVEKEETTVIEKNKLIEEFNVDNPALEDMKVEVNLVEEDKKVEKNDMTLPETEKLMQFEDVIIDISKIDAGPIEVGDPDQSEFMKRVQALQYNAGSMYDRVKRLKKDDNVKK
jgi:hypothetical protein